MELLLLRVLQGVGVILGGLIAGLSYVAYRRHGAGLMIFIAFGFGLLTVGLLIEGLLFELFAISLDMAHLVESTVTLAGLMVLAYYLMPRRRD